MIEEPPILTIRNTICRPSADQLTALQELKVSTSIVSDALSGKGSLSSSIKHINSGCGLHSAIIGPALTADCGPADILAVLASLKFIQPGDMVIAAFSDHQNCAVLGDKIIGMMKNNGAAGFVTDGPMRDFDGIVASEFPVWCTGLNPASPFSNGPGTIGFEIQIGGQNIKCGDIVVADRDGVVVIPFDKIDDTLVKIKHIKTLESELDKKIAGGLKLSAAIEELLQSEKVRYSD